MEKSTEIFRYFDEIESINYDNREGGKYAYVRFLSLTREILQRWPAEIRHHKFRAAIEGMNSLFNDCLCGAFGKEQRVIFECKRMVLRVMAEQLRLELSVLVNGNFRMAG